MELKSKSRARLWIILIAGVVGLVILTVGGYLIWQSFQPEDIQPKVAVKKTELPRMANLPPMAAIP